MKKLVFIILVLMYFCVSNMFATNWKDWEIGGELGLGVGSGSKSGRLLCPTPMVTFTRVLDRRFLELGMGYMYGAAIEKNYTEEETEYYEQEIIDDAGQDIEVRMSVIPMTVNFFYTIYENFYVGAGVGFYHIFYKEVPLGEYRVNTDSVPGEIVKSPATTALGFQQMVGLEIFPMSEKWNWFAGVKSFLTTSGSRTGGLIGITVGMKVRYTW
ncbi:hypothetical protein ACFLUV_05125 [Elusimicrobiota bacterium]